MCDARSELVNARARAWRASPAGQAWYRRWYETNRERKKAQIKAWREANPDAVKAQMAGRDPERVKKNARKSYIKHRERRLAQSREWWQMNKESRREAQKRWVKSNPDKVRSYYRKYSYGLTRDDYQRLLDSQGGECAICHRPGGPDLHVDHDHATGAVRGLLCRGCNNGLGGFRDSREALRAAIAYLDAIEETREKIA